MTCCENIAPGCLFFRKVVLRAVYVVYLDELGIPSGSRNNQNHFVIAGIVAHEGQIRNLGDGLDRIKSEFFPEIRAPFKFHATDISSGKARRFRDMTFDGRQRPLDEVFRYYERDDDRFINKIMSRFDRRAPGSPADGLKHVMRTSEPRRCVACGWRESSDA